MEFPMPMTRSKRWMTRCLTLAMAFVLSGGPELAMAQQNPAAPQQPPQARTDPQAPDTQPPADAQTPDQPAQTTDQPAAQTPNQPAQTTSEPAQTTDQQSQSEQAVQQQQQTSHPGIIDPSKGPLTPAPTANQEEQPQPSGPQNLPDAPSATQGGQQPTPETTSPRPKPRTTQPVGVGTAQEAPTAGGAASKPAGAAIAPAKQKQYRSLLIKIGAIAGAGAALGTVFALSRGTKSTPPGAR
jgi:hypothetical protein